MNPNLQLADAIRNVTLAMQREIEEGQRSRMIDADDLVEVLLELAGQLDPPFGEPVDSGDTAPVR